MFALWNIAYEGIYYHSKGYDERDIYCYETVKRYFGSSKQSSGGKSWAAFDGTRGIRLIITYLKFDYLFTGF